jgi:PilZ domain-containing protein
MDPSGTGELGQPQRRRAKRKPLVIHTTVRHGPFQQADIKIEDLSFTGFAAACEVPLRAGSYISVALPMIGLVRARVVWITEGKVGGEFLRPVDVRRCFPDLE